MLTFSTPGLLDFDPLAELKPRKPQDLVEVGESNDFWIKVRRSTKQIELISKQTGKLVAKCPVNDSAQYGLTEKQILAAKKGLE